MKTFNILSTPIINIFNPKLFINPAIFKIPLNFPFRSFNKTNVDSSLCCALTPIKPTYFLHDGVVPPLWAGQVSIAGSAIANLQRELSSSSAAARKIIKTVKSPSPSRAATETRVMESVPSPFKDSAEKYQSHYGAELQTGVVYSGGTQRVYEDWEAQVCN